MTFNFYVQQIVMRLLFCLTFILIAQSLSSQRNEESWLNFAANLAQYRNENISGHEEDLYELELLLKSWNDAGVDEEIIARLLINIKLIVLYDELYADWIQDRVARDYSDYPLLTQITPEQIQTIKNNSRLLNLILFKITDDSYPFRILSESIIYEEIEYYNIQPQEQIAVVEVADGFFGLLLCMFETPLKLYLTEYDNFYIPYIENSVQTDFARYPDTRVFVIESSKSKTGLAKHSTDKIILRQRYHHLKNPNKLLASIHKSLKPGGIFYVREPDYKLNEICERILPKEDVIAQISKKGFLLQDELNLNRGYVLAFRKSPD